MYKNFHNHKLEQTVSSLNDNLDVLVEKEEKDEDFRRISFVTVSKTNVDILHCQKGEPPTTVKVIKENVANRCLVLQAKWCHLSEEVALVITTYKGVLIFDSEGHLLLFWHNLCEDGAENNSTFCRGISDVKQKFICVGTSEGNLIMMKPDKNSFVISQTIKEHKSPISALSSPPQPSKNSVDLVSADDSGSICVYTLDSKLKFLSRLPTNDENTICTALQLRHDGTVFAGYFNGKIRVFDSVKSLLLAEISAHARSVTCMDVFSDSNSHMVISGSEDSFIRVWKISRKDTIKVLQEWYSSIKDFRLCGLKFCGSKGKYFAVTGYDSHEVIQFIKSK